MQGGAPAKDTPSPIADPIGPHRMNAVSLCRPTSNQTPRRLVLLRLPWDGAGTQGEGLAGRGP